MEINYQQVISEGLKELPPEALAEVASFITLMRKRLSDPIGYLKDLENFLQTSKTAEPTPENDRKRGKEALMKYIGGVSHGSLAQNIDEELYGE